MKVAHIVGKLKKAGVESVVFEYLRHMNLEGVEVHVLYDADSTALPPADLVSSGIKFIEIPPYQKLPSYISAIIKLCRNNKYDLVHSHMNALSVFPLFAAKLGKVPVRICHNHTTSSGLEKKRDLAKRILRPLCPVFATDLAACSELAGRWMYGDKVFESGKVTVFNNAIDIDRFRFSGSERERVRSELGIGDSLLIGHVGRFAQTKNHTFLIDIFSELKKIRPDAKLILIGEGETLDETTEKVKKLDLEDSVIFKGIVQDTEKYYFAMDAFLLPSLYEGLPVVALEAEASGLPCFISDSVTCECDVTGKVTFLPTNQKPEHWAERIAAVGLQAEGSTAGLGADGVAVAGTCDRLSDNEIFKKGKFNIENSAPSLRDYYGRLTAGK